MKHTARSVVYQALLQMEEKTGYSNLVLDSNLEKSDLDPRDKAFASSLYYGVLEKKLALDYYLFTCLDKPGKKVDKRILIILRCAAYQLLFMDRIPPSAAVNEAVELAKQGGRKALAGMVNAVLRKLIANKDEIALPSGTDVASLSIRFSIPTELISMWHNTYGESITLRILEEIKNPAQTYIRINAEKTSVALLRKSLEQQSVCLETLSSLPDLAILDTAAVTHLDAFHAGWFHVQDLSAQLACYLMNPAKGAKLLDVCAAPGGKTFTLSQMMGCNSQVTAVDLHESRVALIRQMAKRLGLNQITTIAADARKLPSSVKPAEYVLCDVPCSGYGVIRRKPEIRYKTLESVSTLPNLQKEILCAAAERVVPGGYLLYCTCTLNQRENQQVADHFLKVHSNFSPVALKTPDFIERILDEPKHCLTIFPFSGGSDGFFVALFRNRL